MKIIITLIIFFIGLVNSNAETVDDIAVCKHSYVLCFDDWDNNGVGKPGKGKLFGNGFFLDVTGGSVSTSKGKVNLSVVNEADDNHVTQYIANKYGADYPDDHYNSWRLRNAQDVIAMKVTAKSKLIFFLQGNNKSGKDARIPKISKNSDLSDPLNPAPDENHPTTDSGFRFEWTAPDDMTIYIGTYNGDTYFSYLIVEANEAPGTPSVKVGDQTYADGLWFREVTCKANKMDDFGTVVTYTTDGTAPTAASPLYTGPIKCYQEMTIKFQAFMDLGDGKAVEGAEAPGAGNDANVNFKFDAPTIEADGGNIKIVSPYEGQGAVNFYNIGEIDVEGNAFTLTEPATVTAYTKIMNGIYGSFKSKSSSKYVSVLEPIKEKKTVAEALGIINALENGKTTAEVYQVKGFLVGTPDFQRKADGTLYGNVNLDIADEKGGSVKLTVYQGKSYDNEAFTEETISLIEEGDEVVFQGKLQKYVKDGIVTPRFTNCFLISVKKGNTRIIQFADANVKALCVQQWDTNGDGELSEAEAAVVTDLESVFKDNQIITSFKELHYFSGLTSIGNNAFRGCSDLTSITIPNSVTSIGRSTFRGCSGLTSVNIPNSVTSIGEFAFEGCSGLTSVTIGNSVTSICDNTFRGCSGLTSITIGNSVTSIGNEAFFGCSSLTSVNIPNSVTSIGGSAFADCSSLTSITIPNSVTSIGNEAFYGCSSLSSVTIPNSVTSIGNSVFQGCNGLTSVTIGNSVTSIGSKAFDGCTKVKTLTIGKSVSNIGEHAFAGFDNLTDVTCYAVEVPKTDRTAFEYSYIEHVSLHVPKYSVGSYKESGPWKFFKEVLAIVDGDGMEKCATPTISYKDGKLKFSCTTEGVQYKYKLASIGFLDGKGEQDEMPGKYAIIVYATKEGMIDSDTATLEFTGTASFCKKGDMTGDGEVDVTDVVELIDMVLAGE